MLQRIVEVSGPAACQEVFEVQVDRKRLSRLKVKVAQDMVVADDHVGLQRMFQQEFPFQPSVWMNLHHLRAVFVLQHVAYVDDARLKAQHWIVVVQHTGDVDRVGREKVSVFLVVGLCRLSGILGDPAL